MENCIASENGNNIYLENGEITTETILKISPNNNLVLEFKKELIKKLKARQKRSKKMKTPKVFLA